MNKLIILLVGMLFLSGCTQTVTPTSMENDSVDEGETEVSVDDFISDLESVNNMFEEANRSFS